jgi:hypothetical protein
VRPGGPGFYVDSRPSFAPQTKPSASLKSETSDAPSCSATTQLALTPWPERSGQAASLKSEAVHSLDSGKAPWPAGRCPGVVQIPSHGSDLVLSGRKWTRRCASVTRYLPGRRHVRSNLHSTIRRTLAISCEGRTTAPWFTMSLADDDAPTRIQSPLVSCIALFDGSLILLGRVAGDRADHVEHLEKMDQAATPPEEQYGHDRSKPSVFVRNEHESQGEPR